MAKKATAKAANTTGKAVRRSSSSGSGGGGKSKSSSKSDPVDALVKLLQSPLVIDLLAVGATAALAAITESRSGRTEGAVGTNKRTLKAAGKAAAAAVGRRLATEIDEIREASKRAGEERQAKSGAQA
ncbi:hypothetical protein GCM10023264_06710 [Sphingomonas daechungensis]|uniref:Uncharacterized protein n=1 Tax=Sphingomonas daechungensis TaxID=1176646 RepID=A0ABX6T1C3_9SPHN|nr:hypothetical protein [Sphingomonas daechungensis]QNP43003.1 hypothetical protein H9L15_13580 [Sphingomonas daechungensis]